MISKAFDDYYLEGFIKYLYGKRACKINQLFVVNVKSSTSQKSASERQAVK